MPLLGQAWICSCVYVGFNWWLKQLIQRCYMLRISSSSGRWQVGTWKTDHFDLKLQVMLHFQPLPPFFLTLTVTVRRCELALNLILYIYIVGIKDPIFKKKSSKFRIFQPPFSNLYNSFFVHVNNLILQVSSRKAIHLFCRGSGLLALAIRTRNLTGVPFIFPVGNVFSASPGWPRRKDTKNIQ